MSSKTTFAKVAVSALALLASGTQVLAGETGPVGGRMGALFLHITGEAKTTYTDNAYLEDTSKDSGLYTVLVPGLELVSDWGRHAFGARFAGDFGFYHFNSGDDNYQDFLAQVNGRLDIKRGFYFKVDRLGYERISEHRGSDDIVSNAEEPWRFHKFGSEASLVYRPHRVLLSVSGSYFKSIYDDLEEIGGTMRPGELRDHAAFGGKARAGVAFKRDHFFYVEGGLGRTVYDREINEGAFDRDSSNWSAFAGLELFVSELLQIDAAIGYVSTDYDDAALGEVEGFGARGSIIWSPDRLTTIEAQFRTNVEETISHNAAGRIARSATLTYHRSITRSVVWDADLTYANLQYDGGIVDRRDNDVEVGTGLSYYMNRNVRLGLDYLYQFRNSNVAGEDHRANSVSLTAGLKF